MMEIEVADGKGGVVVSCVAIICATIVAVFKMKTGYKTSFWDR